jgi:hypothetical protein
MSRYIVSLASWTCGDEHRGDASMPVISLGTRVYSQRGIPTGIGSPSRATSSMMTPNQRIRWLIKPAVFLASVGSSAWFAWAALSGSLISPSSRRWVRVEGVECARLDTLERLILVNDGGGVEWD